MRRREVIALLGGAAMARSLPVAAQQPKRLPVVGLVTAGSTLAEIVGPDPANPPTRAFVHGLRDLGWIDGRTIVIERRAAEGKPQRAPAIFAELLARGVDVFMLGGARWLQDAAQRATRTIPMVASFSDDPVAAGQITSLARPGGNLTGLTLTTGAEFYAKRLQLLQQFLPRIGRVGFLAPREIVEQFRGIAPPAGITVVPVQIDGAERYESAFAAIQRERVDALMVAGDAINYTNASRIVAFAAESRLPAMYAFREAVEGGGLMSYGPSVTANFRQAAKLVDRILKGARPADLPVEQPTKFELVVNLKTARTLGLSIAPTPLGLADEVIE